MGLAARQVKGLDRDIKRLRRELILLRDDMRAVSKAVSNGDAAVAFSRLRSGRTVPSANWHAPLGEQPESAMGKEPVAVADHTDDIVPPASTSEGPGPEEHLHDQPAPSPAVRDAGVLDSRDEKFASYFVSGGLRSMGLMRNERRVQRNRAVFMMVILLVALVVFWHWFMR